MNGTIPDLAPPTRVSVWHSVLAALCYGVVSSLMTFCNKALSSSFNFHYPLVLLWVQMATTQAALCVMHTFSIGQFVYPRITLAGLLVHLPVAALYVLNAALAITSLQGMSIPTYGVLKRAGPLFILAINIATQRLASRRSHEHADNDVEAAKASQHVPKPAKGPGSGVVTAVLIIVGGTLVAGGNDLHLSASTFRMALMSNVTQALYVTMVESKHKSLDGGGFNYGKTDPTLGLLAHNSLLSIPLLGSVIFLEGWAYGGASWGFISGDSYSSSLVAVFFLATILGCSLNYTMFMCIRVNSALTTSLVGHAKTAVQTVVGFFVLAQEVHATSAYILGVVLNAIGGFLFTLAKYHEAESRKQPFFMGMGFWQWCLSFVGIRFGRSTIRRATKL